MKTNGNQQSDANRIKKFWNAVQKVAISVEFFWSFKRLKVANHVSNDECKQKDAGYCHHDLLAVGGLPKARRADFTCAYHGGGHLKLPSSLDCQWEGQSLLFLAGSTYILRVSQAKINS